MKVLSFLLRFEIVRPNFNYFQSGFFTRKLRFLRFLVFLSGGNLLSGGFNIVYNVCLSWINYVVLLC